MWLQPLSLREPGGDRGGGAKPPLRDLVAGSAAFHVATRWTPAVGIWTGCRESLLCPPSPTSGLWATGYRERFAPGGVFRAALLRKLLDVQDHLAQDLNHKYR